MTRTMLTNIKRSVVFASVDTETGEIAAISDFTAAQRVYVSLEEFNKVRYRLVIASTECAARHLKTEYHVFPVVASAYPGDLVVFATPTDFSVAILKTGIATPLEETLAAKHAALRYNSVNRF